jgi:hypothetical protein
VGGRKIGLERVNFSNSAFCLQSVIVYFVHRVIISILHNNPEAEVYTGAIMLMGLKQEELYTYQFL